MNLAMRSLLVCMAIAATIAVAPIISAQQANVLAPNEADITIEQETAKSSIPREMETVENWAPMHFEFMCGYDLADFRPTFASPGLERWCLNRVVNGEQSVRDFEYHAESAAADYKATGFDSPYHFGPVIDGLHHFEPHFGPIIDGGSESGKAIRIFDYPSANVGTIARLPSPKSSESCHMDGYRVMQLNAHKIGELPTDGIAFVAAHELFHAVQNGLPDVLVPQRDGCVPPAWIWEAQADAAAIDYYRRTFPGRFPPRTKGFHPEEMAGLRPYYRRLNDPFADKDKLAYRTNSFWLFLGDQFHASRFDFLQDYLKKPAPRGAGGAEDWLRWLDLRLREDPLVDLPLYLVYPDFLTSFAGEWAEFGNGKGGIGRNFGREAWLRIAFGHCETATVSPSAPYVEISEVKLQEVAGKCLSVIVEDIAADDLVAVKIGVLTDNEETGDSLHLGLAFTNDQTGLNCANRAQDRNPRGGPPGCLFEMETGRINTGIKNRHFARMWHGFMLEKGPGPQSARKNGQGEIENVYVLSYVPKEPWETNLKPVVPVAPPQTSENPAISFDLAVGLELAKLAVNGNTVNQGSADGTRKSRRKRAAAAMGVQRLETDIWIPPSTGYIDAGPQQEILGPVMGALVDEALSILSEGNQGWDLFVGSKAGVFSLGEMEVTPVGDIGDSLEILRSFSVRALQGEIPVGTTGTFDAWIIGQIADEHDVIYHTIDGDPARITVIENSHSVFHATVRGRICKYRGAQSAAGAFAAAKAFVACAEPLTIEGEIVKPFAYLYRPESALHSIETEGEKIYNRYNSAGGGLASLLGVGGAGGGGGSGGSGEGGGGAAAGVACDCSCGARPAAQDGAGACAAQCLVAWSACDAVEAPEPPAPEKAAAPRPPTPTVEAQRKWFSRLVGRQDLPPEIEQMLVDDFATMSDETRAYLIRRYRDAVR